MKIRHIAYWVTTGLVAFVFLSGGVGELIRPAALVKGMTHLGYPVYFVSILGVWKVLGGVAVLAPRLPRLKEWAYAGMLFDLTGAAVSHATVGDPVGKIATPLIILGIVIASWALRPESRRLRDGSSTPTGDAFAHAVGEKAHTSAPSA
ncbi:MAG TPA: DoxX family protein [Tepidisphaeraceae bacterium]|jgi:uncharacterized membrane protein YphA (DoxX/SURF4 family)|nr:DoxX family protein [Tepidisphaeraceae bacterium]